MPPAQTRADDGARRGGQPPACRKARAKLQVALGRQRALRAIEEPLRQIAENSGAEGSLVMGRVREGTGAFGYNAATGIYEDLVKAGVIDPTKVVRVALQNAASIASLMLTTEALIVESSKSG